jgi:Na+:H+ antiporter, NhaA family
MKRNIKSLFADFFESERASGFILIICTIVSISLANTNFGSSYLNLWHISIFNKSLEFWINDGLMTIFFLMVGLEIEREIYSGELSNIKKSLLPVLAAVGGMLVPSLIYSGFNYNTNYQSGFGIPMATDIAFSLAVLSLLGKRIPLSLKLFLTALAIIDDLGAILVIALFYSAHFSYLYFGLAMVCFALLLLLNRLQFYYKWLYLVVGMVMWVFMHKSGIHATITGVLLAFAFPFAKGDEHSPSIQLQAALHKPVAFFILPLFALANTAIQFPTVLDSSFFNSNTIGVILGLIIGKPLGIILVCYLAIQLKWASLPKDLKFKDIIGAGCLAGIGFTMSIFITLLAFQGQEASITLTKIAIIIASVVSGILGYFYLKMSRN